MMTENYSGVRSFVPACAEFTGIALGDAPHDLTI
jgi:hypothetical protein